MAQAPRTDDKERRTPDDQNRVRLNKAALTGKEIKNAQGEVDEADREHQQRRLEIRRSRPTSAQQSVPQQRAVAAKLQALGYPRQMAHRRARAGKIGGYWGEEPGVLLAEAAGLLAETPKTPPTKVLDYDVKTRKRKDWNLADVEWHVDGLQERERIRLSIRSGVPTFTNGRLLLPLEE